MPAAIVLDEKAEKLLKKMGSAFGASLAVGGRGARAARTPRSGRPTACSRPSSTRPRRNGIKLGDAMQPVRVALTGGTVSEPVNELLAVVGRDESLARIRAAMPDTGRGAGLSAASCYPPGPPSSPHPPLSSSHEQTRTR